MIGYLGPKGTFTQQAALNFGKPDELVPFRTIFDLICAVDKGKIESGVVPIENSTEGSVNATIDALIFDTNIFIQSEISLTVKQNLMVNKQNKDKVIEKILSHPQALAQCKSYLNKKYGLAEIIEVSSTAKAAELVSKSEENIAAIGISLCAEIYNLDIVEKNINDSIDNKTTFVLLSSNDTSKPIINKKTSLAFTTFNKPGELYKILDIFSIWDINMTKIFSRPMRNKNGEYVFFVDIEGFSDEKDAVDALTMIKRKTNFFKILGTYDIKEL